MLDPPFLGRSGMLSLKSDRTALIQSFSPPQRHLSLIGSCLILKELSCRFHRAFSGFTLNPPSRGVKFTHLGGIP